MLSSMNLVKKDFELKLEDSEKQSHNNSTQLQEVVKSPKKIVKNVMKKITSYEDFMNYQWAWMN